jgi:RNA polymerase II subunit A small phosphatase-like protein
VGKEKFAEDHSTNTTKPKRRGFLSRILTCCSPPENANAVELGDQAGPAKSTKGPQQKPGRQPTPVVKTNASAGESTTGESKEVAEENIGGPEYSEMKPASKPTVMAGSSKEKLTTEKVGPPIAAVEPETQESPAPVAYRDPPLPPVSSPNVPLAQEMKEEQGIPTLAAGIAAPPQLIEPDQSVAQQGTTINDRTPQQETRDSDIVMMNAPPPTSTAEEQAQINLPPPPPRNGNGNGNGNGAASSSNAVVPSEKQRWLLPPLQPHFKGRKCLVLDLDETLVHSSFKVRDWP